MKLPSVFGDALNFRRGRGILAIVIGGAVMLKTLRRGAIENPWFFRIIMGIIAIAFIITMGWGFGNLDSRSENVVATVDKAKISLVDYQRAFQALYQNYRDQYKESENIDEKIFKQAAIDQLIDRQVWLKAAKDLNVSVGNQELMESIAKIPVFQKGGQDGKTGVFDLDRYHQTLARAHMSPEGFEQSQREGLLIEKARELIQDSVQLTQKEIDETRKNVSSGQDPDRAVSDALFLKRQKALLAFSTNLKARSKIDIKHELL
jgi:peptidyl-prolyl cis-trans isomerase D